MGNAQTLFAGFLPLVAGVLTGPLTVNGQINPIEAVEKLELFPTLGDTDTLLLRLTVTTDANPQGQPVSDTGTVTIRLALDPVVELSGTPRGDGQGYFSFDTTSIAEVTELTIDFDFDVVVKGDVRSTQGRGTILNSEALG